MKISVIIPTYNEEAHVKEAIESCLSQSLRPYEIIVIDDGSTDKTVEIVKSFIKVKLIQQDHEGSGAARNKAAEVATGKVLMLIDADMYLEKEMFEKLIKPIEEGKEVGTYWSDEMVANPDNIWSKSWSIAHNMPYDRRCAEDIGEYVETFRAILKDVYIKAGGHHADRANGEDRITDKVGRKSFVVKGTFCYHYNPEDYADVVKSAKWIGKGMIHTYKGIKIPVFLFKYSIFRSIPAGIYKAVKWKNPFFIIFKIIFDWAVTRGYIYALITKDNKK